MVEFELDSNTLPDRVQDILKFKTTEFTEDEKNFINSSKIWKYCDSVFLLSVCAKEAELRQVECSLEAMCNIEKLSAKSRNKQGTGQRLKSIPKNLKE